MLGLFSPLLVYGVYLSKCWEPFLVIIWIILAYSKNPHKEFRFILPAMPIAFLYCGYALNWIQYRKRILGISQTKKSTSEEKLKSSSSFFRFILAIVFLFNGFMILYFSLFYQRAPISVVRYIAEYDSPKVPLQSVHFLTGCHSTPFYSHVHRPIPMRQLDCSPM